MLIALTACGPGESEKQCFSQTYQEILVVRELESDSLEANEKVRQVLEDHGFTEPEFRQLYFDLAEDRESFITMMDSIRARARREADIRKKSELKTDTSKATILRKNESVNSE
jgi:hypothetical protein